MKAIYSSSAQSLIRVHDLPGEGTPLVFLHGLGCASSADYPAVVRDRALSLRRAILIDLFGSGFSDRPADFSYTVSAHAETVIEVIDALHLDRVDLFGHSMGGAIAIAAASVLGVRVEHVIASEPNLDAGGGPFSRAIASQPEAHYIAVGHADTIREALLSGNRIWAGTMAATAPVAAHRSAVSLVAGTSPSWRTQLVTHAASRTVIFGRRSLPDPDTDALAQDGIAIAIVEDAGHSMAWENPSGLAAAIRHACMKSTTTRP